jgi:hypothetical protein
MLIASTGHCIEARQYNVAVIGSQRFMNRLSARPPVRLSARLHCRANRRKLSAPSRGPFPASVNNNRSEGEVDQPYPVQFRVEYPDRSLNRMTTFFRLFTIIPIAIVLGAVSGSTWSWSTDDGSATTASAGGLLVGATAIMIIFRQKYPRWWFDWNLELQRFTSRVGVYLALMDDRYPSTDDHQSVYLDYPYPDVQRDLNRWMPLVKWFLAIPHYFVLIVLNLIALGAVVIAWFAILFTGRYPRSIFDFVEGVMRWNNRVLGYVATLVTDQYPPFRLTP